MDATSEDGLTFELHGFLADRLAALGRRRGSRVEVRVPCGGGAELGALLADIVRRDGRYGLLYDTEHARLPEHVELVLNGRVVELQGGLRARVRPGDVLSFVPASAGGRS